MWEPIDDLHARATVTSHGVTAQAVFAFDVDGRAIAIESERWFGADGPREHWVCRNTEWTTLRGMEVPTRGDVTWRLKSGDFTFFRWRVTDVETGRPRPYADGASAEAAS